MAEDCRRLAAMVKDEAARSQLLAVAQHFDRLADPHHPWNNLAAAYPDPSSQIS
jgi:hypothetical protein